MLLGLTINGSVGPFPSLDAHLNSSQAPVLTMVVTLALDTGASLGLVFGENGQDTENDGDASVKLDTHQALAGRLGDVLKVHGLALDENANGNDGIKGARRRREGREIWSRRGEKVGRRGTASSSALDLGRREEAKEGYVSIVMTAHKREEGYTAGRQWGAPKSRGRTEQQCWIP